MSAQRDDDKVERGATFDLPLHNGSDVIRNDEFVSCRMFKLGGQHVDHRPDCRGRQDVNFGGFCRSAVEQQQ